jgi:L-alanine-DL-glutamate epimerase-like enolase superfamily enzyme
VKITDARVVVSSPGRNYVTLVIETEDGITGIGDATLNGRELAVASYLSEHLCPLLIGRDARRIEDAWQYFYKGAYWRRGPVTMTAIAAIDVALWDIKGKAAGMPVYELLGGAAREGVMVYGHASGQPWMTSAPTSSTTWTWATRPSGRRRLFRAWRRRMASRQWTARRTNRRAATSRRKTRGRPRLTWTLRPGCWRMSAKSSATACTCCTMCITG